MTNLGDLYPSEVFSMTVTGDAVLYGGGIDDTLPLTEPH